MIKKYIQQALKDAAKDAAVKRVQQMVEKNMKDVISNVNKENIQRLSEQGKSYLNQAKAVGEKYLQDTGILKAKDLETVKPVDQTNVEAKKEEVKQEPVDTTKVNDRMNFATFAVYVVTNPEYKDKYGDCSIISFLAQKSMEKDIVEGKAKEWDSIIRHARLLEGSGLERSTAKKITKVMVENLFDKEMAREFGEHFGVNVIRKVKEPVQEPVVAPKGVKNKR